MGLKGVLSRSKFFMSKHSPEICMIAGAVEFGLTIWSACKGTVKFQKAVEKHNERLAKLDALVEKVENGEDVDDDLKDIKATRMSVYTDTAKEFVKCYWPTMLLGAGTLATFGAGAWILNKRLVGATAAAAAALQRTRFLENHIESVEGREALEKLSGHGPDDMVVKTHVDEETGEEVVDELKFLKDRGSVFSVWWDAEHPDYSKQDGANKFTIRKRLNTCQKRLEQNGHLFYNEALRIFGYDGEDLIEAGQIYGWKWYGSCGDDEAKRHGAANRIDIGFDPADERITDKDFLLMFNVDPEPIVGAIGFKKRNDKIVPVTC